jgi:hypothetical protein
MLAPLEKRNPVAGTTGLAKTDLGRINDEEHTAFATSAQRRLASRIAASCGLSLSVAMVLTVVAGVGEGCP